MVASWSPMGDRGTIRRSRPLRWEEAREVPDPEVRVGDEVEVTDPALNTHGMRGEVSEYYPATRHWRVRIRGPHNVVVKVLRREQFEPVDEGRS